MNIVLRTRTRAGTEPMHEQNMNMNTPRTSKPFSLHEKSEQTYSGFTSNAVSCLLLLSSSRRLVLSSSLPLFLSSSRPLVLSSSLSLFLSASLPLVLSSSLGLFRSSSLPFFVPQLSFVRIIFLFGEFLRWNVQGRSAASKGDSRVVPVSK